MNDAEIAHRRQLRVAGNLMKCTLCNRNLIVYFMSYCGEWRVSCSYSCFVAAHTQSDEYKDYTDE